ncbi:aromatic peroxygenase precursor [Coprinopsis marcescibilis]|uniref:Aromatic peroxygenase n=1 Tax=Coprinopsis marcescibilis TaxID=230819 RepID=A0A5C3KHV2_COPMA|nr:aromatic peroxygenase precursor [Coprinopsis marcescibilis]
MVRRGFMLPQPSIVFLLLLVTQAPVLAFPSPREPEHIAQTLGVKVPPPPPGPPVFTGTKLVYDDAHPWMPARPGDMRGPCPGLNTLAAHGYLPRNGIASPSQIITAVQEGFNMNGQAARVATYIGHILEGNLLTDLLSIGGKTRLTGPDPPGASVAGLSNHGTFEGDSSMTRGDNFFGNHIAFNKDLFDQFVEFSNKYGGGFYNLTVAAELRAQRIQQSIATNPNFKFLGLRQLTAYGESVLPINLFVDGRKTGAEKGQLDMDTALSFFRDFRFPKGFFRAAEPGGAQGIQDVFAARPFQPGRNVDGVNTFVVDHSLGSLANFCGIYTQLVNTTVRAAYPDPKGVLRRNLNLNLDYLYTMVGSTNCPQVFPYGRD